MGSQVDYSLYLVTDSTEAILGNRDLVDVVDQALLGGKDKTSDTGVLISTAKALHAKCRQHNIPLLINDRVDVALAVGCEGVHLGQDDMSIETARQILGDDKIIGATVSSIEEAKVAVERGADYLGIGTLYATNTKKNTKDIIGINGIRKILRYLHTSSDEKAKKVKTVCIGGINASNLQRVLYQLHASTPSSSPTTKPIDGAAIVSAIIGSPDPLKATQTLKSLITTPPPFAPATLPAFQLHSPDDELTALKLSAPKYISAVHTLSPLSHNMTNLVVQHISASIALALGASPIMSNNGAEAQDLAALNGALVINMGTATPEALKNHALALSAYNATGNPTVLDPVGAGATSARRSALSFLLSSGYFTLIKGNEAEILALAHATGFTLSNTSSSQQRGVDSGTARFSTEQRASIVREIAARERNIVLMTGKIDVISDGKRTYAIENGHEYLGLITGSGCTLGTTLSAYLAAAVQARKSDESGWEPDLLFAALVAIVHFETAAERAAKREDVKGPGTFVPAFVDEVWKIGRETVEKADLGWWDGVRVRVLGDQEVGEGLLSKQS
ncbi:Hydroxyethylthiazole kinase family-domain-containing protein [Dendryphion nanum]|uniref:Hydroxyethylthiazole kinase family-domain-containing protein n=1 Tax=Dendryphion nanum TaxID=256645 RepID=A0A9P9DVU2_9PLEO|nr:Hydroxyethylthiazole kinase family-domain-containing protein [Dendryphion nanum]